MERRNFVRMALTGSVLGAIAPHYALSGALDDSASVSMAGGVYYTREAPGRWSEKIAGHLPNLEVSSDGENKILRVLTSHEMKGYEHYIVKHVVLDQQFNFISENMFDPTKDQIAMSDFNLGQYQGIVNVLSMCNKHDVWLNSMEI